MYFQILSDIELALKLEQICLFFSRFVVNQGTVYNKTKQIYHRELKNNQRGSAYEKEQLILDSLSLRYFWVLCFDS